MRLFRATWKHPDRGEQTHVSRRWTAEFRWRGQTCRITLFTDERASAEVARMIERLATLRLAGDGPDTELSRWLERAPANVIAYLLKKGILDPRRAAATKTLDQHLSDWERALRAKGNSPRHVDLVVCRAKRVFAECGFNAWSEMRAAAVSDWLASARCDQVDGAGRMIARGISHQTSNFYLAAIKQFARWMVREGRTTESPFQHLVTLNVRVDRRHDRRAWLPDELRRLMCAARLGPARLGMEGPDRALVYQVAAETGLRAGELRSLCRADFDLRGDAPSVTIRAANAKNRRDDVLPLRAATAATLESHWSLLAPAARVFALPRRECVTRMVRADLAAARTQWLDEAPDGAARHEREASDFLIYRDRAGRFLDFHALRHSFVSYLIRGGVQPKVTQRLARHSSITLTMDRYTHLLGGNDAEALRALPDLAAPIHATTPAPRPSGVAG